MPSPSTYRPEPGSIPPEPGVYRFYEKDAVLYVGKAKNLRSRLGSYFTDLTALHPRTRAMVTTAERVDWVVVRNEVEALQLEYSWIKTFEPRFNVKYTDDKSYPYLAVTVGEEFPRITVMRGAKRKRVRYFGPYSHAWAIRQTVDQLLRVFPIRTCSRGVFRRAEMSGRPCLLGYINKCSAPCVGRVSADEHRLIVDDFCSFVAGNTEPYLKDIEHQMHDAAREEDFESAAKLRDDLVALRKALERNSVVFDDRTDADVIALAADQLEGSVQVFHVRSGRVTGQRGFVLERTIGMDDGELVEQALLRLYGEGEQDGVPREVLVSHEPPEAQDLAAWLTALRGSRSVVRRPQRGDKRALMETVSRNATQSLALHKKRRIGDLTTRARALQDLQEALGLDSAPLRVEAYDISTLQGQDTVASMVVFEDGLPRKSDYRRFTVTRANAASDVSAMHEVISRRFRRYLSSRDDSTDPELPSDESAPAAPTARQSFSYPPQLVVVDGGPAQVAAARTALDDLGVSDVPVCGLAKRLEEVWLPDQDHPVVLSRSSQALLLLQQLRDEAHRFAITAHRKKRAKRSRGSALDEVPGLGPAKSRALMSYFKSVRAISGAATEDLERVSGIGPTLARAIVDHLAGVPRTPAVNLTTGEIVERGGSEDST